MNGLLDATYRAVVVARRVHATSHVDERVMCGDGVMENGEVLLAGRRGVCCV
jgi:hypothetical protein